jgi:hypothetical protein
MKRIFVTLSAVALIAVAAQAQAQGMYAGIKAGANFANIGGSDADTYLTNHSTRTGFLGGLYVGKNVNDKMGFRIEGLYAMKGAKYDQTIAGTTYSGTAKLDYIDFPILFVYNLTNTEKMAFNLFAGPTLGFNIKHKVEVNGQTADIDNIKSFEFGGAIGAGVEHKMANGKGIGLDARYSMGATSVSDDVNGQSVSIKNRGFGVMASFSVPVGHSAK